MATPALAVLGVDAMQTHFFVFYYGVLADTKNKRTPGYGLHKIAPADVFDLPGLRNAAPVDIVDFPSLQTAAPADVSGLCRFSGPKNLKDLKSLKD